jgi:hypothetical protein
LRIGDPNDAFEQEADRVAEEVISGRPSEPHWSLSTMRMTAPLQRKCSCGASISASGDCEACKTKEKEEQQTVQRKATAAASPAFAPSIVHEVLNSPGEPLDQATRDFFEPRFGQDLGNVRIHRHHRAAQSAQAVNASAYTLGEHVVLGSAYNSSTLAGKSLLAHELAHSLQQRHSHGSLSAEEIGKADDLQEREADAAAQQIVASGSKQPFPVAKTDGTRSVLRRAEGPGSKETPLSEAELFKILITERAFSFSAPGVPVEDPKGVGRGVGPQAGGRVGGDAVFSIIQITDRDGRLVDRSIGRYFGGGDEHAEHQALDALRFRLEGKNIEGGTMMVILDQDPCPPSRKDCQGLIQGFARDFKLLPPRIRVPTRRSVRRGARPDVKAKPRTVARGAQRTDFPPAELEDFHPTPSGGPSPPKGGVAATPKVPGGAAAGAGKSAKKMTAKTNTPLKPPSQAGPTPEATTPASPAATEPATTPRPRPQISGRESHEGETPPVSAPKATPKVVPGELEGEQHVPSVRGPAGAPKAGVTPEIEPETPHTPAPRVGAPPPGTAGSEMEGAEMGAAAGAVVGEAIKVIGAILIQRYFVDPQNEEAIGKQLEQLKPEIEKQIEANKNQVLSLTQSGKTAYVNVTIEIEYQANHDTGLNFFAGLKLVTVEIGASAVQKEKFAEKGLAKSFFNQMIGHTDLLITFPENEYRAKEGAAAPPVKSLPGEKVTNPPAPAHATPLGVQLPSTPQRFPSIEEQRGKGRCPTCHGEAEPEDESHIPEEFKKPMMTEEEMREWLKGQGY